MTTRSRTIDDNIMEAIRKVIKEENKVLCDKLDNAITKLEALSAKCADNEKGLSDCAAKVEEITSNLVPRLFKKVTETMTQLSIKLIDMDCHSRKWSLIVHGVKGEPHESNQETAKKCVELATNFLGVRDASVRDFAACHRLKADRDAGIIVRFVDLNMRDRWLAGAKGLTKCPERVSISPDLPPVTRILRTELVKKRNTLPADIKRKSSIRYLKTWPYVQLSIKNEPSIVPNAKKESVIESFLGQTLKFDLDLKS